MNVIKALLPQANILTGEIAWLIVFGAVYFKSGDVTTAIAAASSAGLAVAHLFDSATTITTPKQ
jgi:hypothetical protein